jgi:hypothetical protein
VKARSIIWEPGNCTRYDCIVASVEDSRGEPCVLLTWLKNAGSGGPSVLITPWSVVSVDYICEKMEINVTDGAALLAMLKQKCGVEVHMPHGYDDNGCRI